MGDRSPAIANLKSCLDRASLVVDLLTDRKDVQLQTTQSNVGVIVLDLLWSQGEALTVLPEWRRAGLSAHVLALGGKRNTIETIRALDMGADDVLSRPFNADELMARVRALVRRCEPLREKVCRVHDLEIDKQAHVVRRGGRAIPLTPREFALLELLAEQPGHVVTRSTIWQHLYADDGEQLSNVVDVYIRYLRNKIDRGHEVPLILTRWGQGYLLRGERANCA